MTTNDTVTTWRDLTDQLTAHQVAELELWEQLGNVAAEALLDGAYRRIRENNIQQTLAGVPVPRECIDTPSLWTEYETDVWQRAWTCWQRQACGIRVVVVGYQYSDGRPVERHVFYEDHERDEDMSAGRARVFGMLLLEAADELNRMVGDEPPF